MSERATVCYRHVHGELGGATVWMVRLPGGFTIDCGSAFRSEVRAIVLTEMINGTDPDQLTDEGLDAAESARWSK